MHLSLANCGWHVFFDSSQNLLIFTLATFELKIKGPLASSTAVFQLNPCYTRKKPYCNSNPFLDTVETPSSSNWEIGGKWALIEFADQFVSFLGKLSMKRKKIGSLPSILLFPLLLLDRRFACRAEEMTCKKERKITKLQTLKVVLPNIA